MYNFLQDVRYSLRTFKRTPTFTIVVLLSLVLAIGASTAIFSLLNAVLLRSLPYPQPDNLLTIWEDNSKYGFPRNLTSPATYKDCVTQNNSFEQVAASRSLTFNLTGGGDPEEVNVVAISANLFSTIGVQPMLGRDIQAEEDQPGSNRVALLSYALWAGRYGGDAGVLNQNIYLNDQPYTVVGVIPRGIDYPDSGTQIWIPIAFTPEDWARRTSHFVRMTGRLKQGVSLEQAKQDMMSLGERLGQDFPQASIEGIHVVPLKELLLGNAGTKLLLFVAAIGCVLLITCSNTANLMLVRAARRRKETAVRIALGASRSRLIRQWLTESLLLASVGGAAGLLLAPFSFNLLKVFIPEGIATAAELRLDTTVLAFTLVITLLTALIFGTVPALQSIRMNPNDALKQGGERSAIGGSRRLQKMLVIAEVSLALLPLVGAALLIQTYSRLRNVELGFKPEGVLTMRTPLSAVNYPTPEQRRAFFEDILNRVQSLPGVESAGYINYLPLTARGVARGFLIEGQPAPAPGEMPLALYRPVSAGYFETMKMPLIRGRYLDRTDTASSYVAVINEAMAKRYWPNEDPIGRRFSLPGVNPPDAMTIVGIVGDVRETGVNADIRPAMYLSYLQFSQPNFLPADLAIRTKGDPLMMASAVREQIRAVGNNQPISRVRTMEDILDSEVNDRRINMLLLTLFAAIAIIQAMLGIYGVLASIVNQQTREIGLRMALGASPAIIWRKVVGQGMGLVLTGVAIGLIASFALARFVASLLYGVSATDPLTFAAASIGVIVVAMVAIYIPARRAMRIDPMEALRLE